MSPNWFLGTWTPSKVGLSVLEKAWGKGLSFHTPGKQDDFIKEWIRMGDLMIVSILE
jgi:hypothetical protein